MNRTNKMLPHRQYGEKEEVVVKNNNILECEHVPPTKVPVHKIPAPEARGQKRSLQCLIVWKCPSPMNRPAQMMNGAWISST